MDSNLCASQDRHLSKEGHGFIAFDGQQGRRCQGFGEAMQRELVRGPQVGYREWAAEVLTPRHMAY